VDVRQRDKKIGERAKSPFGTRQPKRLLHTSRSLKYLPNRDSNDHDRVRERDSTAKLSR
jgi:hypothetical protein